MCYVFKEVRSILPYYGLNEVSMFAIYLEFTYALSGA